jgi:ankyrin repeat protein
MYFLIANNLNIPILNLSYLCKLAIRNENLDILTHLINKNTNIFNEDQTLLHYACSQRNLEILKFVIKNSKTFDYKDENEETALHWAVMKGSYHIIEELISNIKETNAQINPRNKVFSRLPSSELHPSILLV